MTTLIPAYGSVTARMTNGERRFAQRLESKLEDDYLCWYNVAVGDKQLYPDFIIVHPQRGLLVLEVKDWGRDSIKSVGKHQFEIHSAQGILIKRNPLEQARDYMLEIVHVLQRDPQLVHAEGTYKGQPLFPYGHGVVLTGITRKQFDETDLYQVIPSSRVICQDEMTESVDAGLFQQRLWDMQSFRFKHKLSLPQIDRIRWHIFPEIRIDTPTDAAHTEIPPADHLPELLQVMDIQQEQLARSLGEGHRIIHGVAGSGKTLILGYRAEHLAQACQRPILVLCYNRSLATKLESVMRAKGLHEKVVVENFHSWCVRQLGAYHIDKPLNHGDNHAFYEACVRRVIDSVDKKHIPSGQYDAVLIDEGHDFRPEWFKLIVQMIHPDSNSLLVLYDDAQSIYGSKQKRPFTFSSVGIEARGRTTILKINYRNTLEILKVAQTFASELLTASATADDSAPTIAPMSAGRHGPPPLLIKLPTLRDEAEYLSTALHEAKRKGLNWNEMAIVYRYNRIIDKIADVFEKRKIPIQIQGGGKNNYSPSHDSVKIITMHSSKGLEFPLVCIPSLGDVPEKADDEQEEKKLLYVAMTRATHELIMTFNKESVIVEKMRSALQ